MVDDPFAPPAPDTHRQKTPDCKHHETPEEREDNRARGVFGAAECAKPHVCNLYAGHAAERHRARKCGHWFGLDADSPSVVARARYDADPSQANANALLKTFPRCDCGSVDKHGDDLGEHSPSCPYHRAAVAAFGVTSFTGSAAPVEAWPQIPSSIRAEPPVAEVTPQRVGVKCPHCDADLTAGARIGDSTRALADEHAKTCPEPGSFRGIERASVSFGTPPPSRAPFYGGRDEDGM